MKCFTCKAWSFVLETRTRKADGLRQRRYECANEHRFTTLEIPVRVDTGKLTPGKQPKPRD